MTATVAGDRAFVVTYKPLVSSAAGRHASKQFRLPPFIDGSIRREPDLEHPRPMISCLCRADKFAPRLKVGDHVAYLTAQRRYGTPKSHWRLTAVLRATDLLYSHEEAASWYRALKLKLPNNCMVEGNEAMPLERSHGLTRHGGAGTREQIHRRWDAGYRHRARQFGRVVVCELVFRNLTWKAPIVTREHFQYSFGGVPGTQNPGARPLSQLQALMQRLQLPALPSSR